MNNSTHCVPQHTHTTPHQTTTTVFSTPCPSSPSTATSQAFLQSSLTQSPFRYYLPHISTSTTPIYTQDPVFACTRSLAQQGMHTSQTGAFYQYVPRESTEMRDVYTHARGGAGTSKLGVAVEVRERSGVEMHSPWDKGVITDSLIPEEAECGLQSPRPEEFLYWPIGSGGGEEDVNSLSYTAGEIAGSSVGVEEKQMSEQDQRASSGGRLAQKMRRMLRRLHLGGSEK